MKLRIRSLSSRETLKLEVSDTCTVRELKEILSLRLSEGGSSSSVSPDQLFLTLNRKDELSGSSLQSVGVTSGDLLFYSSNPNPGASSSQTANVQSQIDCAKNSGKGDAFGAELKSNGGDGPLECQIGGSGDAQKEGSMYSDAQAGETRTLGSSLSQNAPDGSQLHASSGGQIGGVEDMEVDEDDDDEDDDVCLSDAKTTLSGPTFLKKVFEDEIGLSADGADSKLLKVAVHAVLLESGFVRYDPVSGTRLDGFRIPDQYPSSTLYYTIPEVLSSTTVQNVALKFQSLGKFVNIVGSLTNMGSVYRVSLDGSRFAPALNMLWKNGNPDDSDHKRSGHVMLHSEKEVFEFWRNVKDGIALPLLIDLCEIAGLVSPSCFMLLPTELKLKILESLTGTALARITCVCTELRFLSSNNELWKQKYEEEFGNALEVSVDCSWKFKFSWAWERRKKIKRACLRRRRVPGLMNPYYPLRDRNPFGVPFMIGGDYDRFGVPGGPAPFGRFRMNFTPNCNLGGFNH